MIPRLAMTLDEVLGFIRREFGNSSIGHLGDSFRKSPKVIPTGCRPLDKALGSGGLPRGRIVEFFGHESSGKTTLALGVIASAQQLGAAGRAGTTGRAGASVYIDVEHALDPAYAKRIGVDLDDLIVAQPTSAEEALTICERMAKSGAVDVIVVDSVAALTPQAEIDGFDPASGLQARILSQALRRIASALAKSNTLCIFLNQVRDRIGALAGNPEMTPGGKALKLRAACRLQVQRIGMISAPSGVIIGNRTRVRVVKNTSAGRAGAAGRAGTSGRAEPQPALADAEFDLLYSCGIPRETTHHENSD